MFDYTYAEVPADLAQAQRCSRVAMARSAAEIALSPLTMSPWHKSP